MSFYSRKTSASESKIKDKFNVIIIGSINKDEKLFLNSFPMKIPNSNIRAKYLNRFELSIREAITFPEDFSIAYYPEILDKLKNIDILILNYNINDKLSFKYLQKFYHLYFTKMEDTDKPKNVIILESKFSKDEDIINEEKVDRESSKKLTALFNGHFCDYDCDEEKLNQVLSECLKNILESYNYLDDYSSFKYKDLSKEINSYIIVFGDKSIQNTFLDMLLKSTNIFKYKKIKDNFYEINYEKAYKDDKKIHFKIILKLANNEYFYDSECNLFLYDLNNDKSYDSIKNLIRGIIKTNGPKFKKIYELLSFKSTSNKEDEIEKIKKGKNLAYEIGGNFSLLNMNNDNNLEENIKIKFDSILEQIINYIYFSKNIISKDDSGRKSYCCNNESEKRQNNFLLDAEEIDLPITLVRETNDKIKKELKNDKHCLFNICKKCFGQLNIYINELSNAVIVYCEKCKSQPIGFSINQFLNFNKDNHKYFHCKQCKNPLNYNIKQKKKECKCNFLPLEQMRNNNNPTEINDENTNIPIFLKDCFCEQHSNYYKYYLKYSKIGLCSTCFKEKNQNNNFIEKFSNDEINKLLEQMTAKLKMEKEHINNLQLKLNECINSLQLKFEKLIGLKIKKHIIKSDIINSLKILKNNSTLISNVKSLQFDIGQNWNYKENDSIENRIKYIDNYFNFNADITNIYFDKNSKFNENIHITPPYYNLEQNENKVNVTDIWGLKNSEFICVSFNNGQAKVFDLKASEDKYREVKCCIKEFKPNQGIHSLFISKNDNNILKINNYNKNDVIFLNGYEEIKIIQMNNDYSEYNTLYTIKDEDNNISYSVEITNNIILYLTMKEDLKLVTLFMDENHEIKDNKFDVSDQLIDCRNKVLSISRINDKLICLNLTKNEEFQLDLSNNISFSFNIENEEDILRHSTVRNIDLDNEQQEEKEKKYMEIISIKINNEEAIKTIKEYENIKNFTFESEYILTNKYQLVGCLSEEQNLLILNYINNKSNKIEYQILIFDCNIKQFIYSFKLQDKLIEPKFLIKLDFYQINDKQGFIMLDKDFNILQYFYDAQFVNKIYYINEITSNESKNNQIKGMFNLIKKNISI